MDKSGGKTLDSAKYSDYILLLNIIFCITQLSAIGPAISINIDAELHKGCDLLLLKMIQFHYQWRPQALWSIRFQLTNSYAIRPVNIGTDNGMSAGAVHTTLLYIRRLGPVRPVHPPVSINQPLTQL